MIAEIVDGASESGVRLVVMAEQVLDTGTGRREPHPQRHGRGGNQRQTLEQGVVAVVELAGRDQHPGPGQEQLDT